MVQVEAQLSTDELLRAVGRLPLPELEQFVQQVLALEAQRRTRPLPQAEAELLLMINEGLPAAAAARFHELDGRRRAGLLTPPEQDELGQLAGRMEALDARRVEYLAELARVRRTTLPALMDTLGIHAPPYA